MEKGGVYMEPAFPKFHWVSGLRWSNFPIHCSESEKSKRGRERGVGRLLHFGFYSRTRRCKLAAGTLYLDFSSPSLCSISSIRRMADVVAGAAAVEVYKDGKSLLTSGSSKIAYVKDLKKNYKKLIQEARKLWELREAIETEISRHKISPVTREWIVKVEMIRSEVGELETKYNDERKHPWRLVRIWPHSNLSKDIAEKCKQVQGLLEEGNLKRGILVAELPEPVRKIHAPKLEHNSFLHQVVEDVVSFLDDKQIRIIGIWGTVGTGKTTIMQNLNNHKDVATMFDIVIWVTVSKEWSLKKLQGAIMQRLKLNMESTVDIEENAWRISEELKGKKCLILMDEVCDFIDLQEVMGIQDHQESKVVLASRLRDICKDMDADELINVKPLSDHEAFNMFKEKVGRSIHFPGIKPVAELVVRECGGLPLLIDRVARTFRKKEKNVSLWRDGLNNLRRWENTQGMDEVLEFLRFCYDNLDSDAKKVCFLYGALYPEEYEIYIDYLLECWRAEGFIPDADEFVHDENVFRDARDKGHAILDDLINVSLLESSEKRKCVKMNKVLRDMALKISSQIGDSKFLAKPCEGLEEPPNHEEWKQARRISLMDNELCSLPETLDCCDLLTLLLQRNKNLSTIPKFFFKSMSSLRVLDLHGTSIESLPSSLSSLICLRGLYLNSCIHLVELPTEIEALVQLEVLDIRGTKISLLQIRSLVWLKCLRISLSNFGMGGHTQNQLGNVSRFVSLEEFSVVFDSSKQWWDKIVEAISTEVATLKRLTSLQFCFPKVDCLEVFVTTSPVWKKGSCLTFQFAVGDHDSTCFQILESFDYPSYNRLTLVNSEGVNPVISKVLMETHAFGLINHKGVSRLSDFGIENMDNMLVCLIERCNEIETIINGNGITKGVLECLEDLRVNNVLKLESIWQGPVHAGSLTQLTSLTLVKCPELKKIFSNGMIQQLFELQHLRVEECDQIEEIIMESENIGLESCSLPRLKTLVLLDLPKLKSIWVSDSLEWPSLQSIKISMCDMLKRLPFNIANAAKLRLIEGQQSWWGALVWEDDAIKQRLQPLCILN